MNFFSKLFFSASTDITVKPHDNTFEYIKSLFEQDAEFYTCVPLFYHNEKEFINYMMIHPVAGVTLFNFFDYSAEDLAGTSVSTANAKDKNPDIKTDKIKHLIENRLDELFHSRVVPIRTVLICNNLSEDEFNNLDQSFHILIPKTLTLFNTSTTETYTTTILGNTTVSRNYELDTIKRALFGEFLISENNALMTDEQQKVIHTDLGAKNLIQGLPGSGKSSLLIAKALYEKMKDPNAKLAIFAPRTCHVHHIQSMIFQLVESSHWGLNPANITVYNFDMLLKLSKEKHKYDLVVCDEINKEDLSVIETLLNSKGKLLVSSSHTFEGFETHFLSENFRLSPAICAACEGFKVQKLNNHLSLQNDSTIKNILGIIDRLLKDSLAQEISILHYNIEDLHHLQTAINHTFSPVSRMYDDPETNEGIRLYPLSYLTCIQNKYIILILDQIDNYDGIDLITHAHAKTFVLSEDKDVYQLINLIKGKTDEPY